jgi:hypothetical protein
VDALDELLSDLQDLLEAQTSAPTPARADEGNFRCVRCEGCVDCRFCMECRDCDECTYCEGCEGCRGCTQCKLCRDCDRTSHSLLSRACDACSYVTLSVGCEECVHCFACVGLAGAEFCVLNERYSRRDYQVKVAELKAALEPRLAAGWRPSWWRDEDEAASAQAEEAAPIVEPEAEPEPESEPEDDGREPDAPTGGHRLEEAVAARAVDSVRFTTAAAPRPTHPDEAHTTSPGGPSVTRAHRPAAAAHPAASPPASVLTGRRPQRG